MSSVSRDRASDARPHSLNPARVRVALLALALGGFAIGSTEFSALGLLPQIAADLLPDVWRVSHPQAVAQSGILVSAYAAGVVVGAPTIAAFSARSSHKKVLLVLLAVVVAATLLTAVLPSFGLVVAARFVSGLPHGAYFGVASLVAADLLGPGNRGKAAASVLGGLTIANVVGVPALTFLGQNFGWRPVYLIVAGLFALTFVAILVAVPMHPGDRTATVRNELRAFTRSQVWLTLGMGAVGFGGLFAAYTYISPITTSITHLPTSAVPFVLIVFGVGMTIGNYAGGFVVDRGVQRSVIVFFGGIICSLVLLSLTASSPVGLFVCVAAIGAASAGVSLAVQVRLQDVARDSRMIAPALNASSLNVGNALGAGVGGLTIAAGLGYLAPIEVGALMGVIGLLIAVLAIALERRSRRLAFA